MASLVASMTSTRVRGSWLVNWVRHHPLGGLVVLAYALSWMVWVPGLLGTWLYNRTGSVLLCVLLHGSFTPALDHLILAEDSTTVDLVIVLTMLAGAAVLVALTRGRLGFDLRPQALGLHGGTTGEDRVALNR